MYIELSDILSVTNKELDIPASIEMNRFVSKTDDYEIISKSPFTVHLKNTGKKKLSISFETVVSLNIPCSRCLADVRNDIHIEVNKIIDMNESDHEEIDLDEQSFIEGKELNLEMLIYKEILVNLPMKVLCNENCKGICNRCGANLNIQSCDCDRTELDPRMSRIKDIFNNFKEV